MYAALQAGSYAGGLGRVTPRMVSPKFAGRTGSNIRGTVLDSYLDRNTVKMGRLGDAFNACTDDGYRAASAVTTSLLDVIGGYLTSRAGTEGTDTYDRGFADAGRAASGAGDVYSAGYAAACAPAPGSGATSPSVGGPTSDEITAMLLATREELSATRSAATNAEIERARAEAANTQRNQQYLMIGGGVALLALVAVVALRK